MAEEDEVSEDEIEGEGKPKSKLKLILMIVALVVILGGAGGGAYWYFMMGDEQVAEGDESAEGDAEEEFDEDRAVAIYHRIRPAFRTTFSANNRQRYMQVEVTLVTRKEEVVAALVTHQPLIVNALVMLFADADYLELQTPEGKETLRLASLAAIEKILQEEAEIDGIEKVLFTQFVMQ